MNYAVLGNGLTGQSVAKYLLKQGHKVTIYENTKELADLSVFDEIVISPGIPRNIPEIRQALKNNQSVIGDIELFSRMTDKPIIGITGTNGKSTVSYLVYFLLKNYGIKVALGGNFGIPALDLLEQDADVYVLEISSFQLESCKNLKLFAGTCLNLAPDHLDRYENLEAYYQAKLTIYNYCRHKIINNDDDFIKSRIKTDINTRFFSLDNDEVIINIDNLKITGRHNLLNIYAALELIRDLVPIDKKLLSGLYIFEGLLHRTENVAEINGVKWINDSKGTNVAATAAAVGGIDSEIILIAGGISKNADFAPLSDICKNKVSLVILYGRDAKQIAESLNGSCEIILVNSLEEAVKKANDVSKNGEVVLFSPACSSFDMFKNFEHRGDVFKGLVKKLVNG